MTVLTHLYLADKVINPSWCCRAGPGTGTLCGARSLGLGRGRMGTPPQMAAVGAPNPLPRLLQEAQRASQICLPGEGRAQGGGCSSGCPQVPHPTRSWARCHCLPHPEPSPRWFGVLACTTTFPGWSEHFIPLLDPSRQPGFRPRNLSRE